MDITAAIVADFRLYFPEFTDVPTWSDPLVTRALQEGDVESGGCGWGGYVITDYQNFKLRGFYTYAAHWLISRYPSGTSGNISQGAKLSVASKSVGDESISFENGKTKELSAGDIGLSTTVYGQDFLKLRKRAGMGARAV